MDRPITVEKFLSKVRREVPRMVKKLVLAAALSQNSLLCAH
jgi:hypothetical protein